MPIPKQKDLKWLSRKTYSSHEARKPKLVYEFEGERFKLSLNTPANEPPLQEPPRPKERKAVSAGLEYICPIPLVLFQSAACGVP